MLFLVVQVCQKASSNITNRKGCPTGWVVLRLENPAQPSPGQKQPPRLDSMICYGQEWARKSHRDPAERFVTAKSGQKEPPRPGSTICYSQEWARKSHQDPAVRFVMVKSGQKEPPKRFVAAKRQFVAAKSGLEKATKTRQYDCLRPRMGQKKPARPASTICYGQVGQK